MNSLLLNIDTRLNLKHLLSIRPHALMIIGDRGSGKKQIARELSCELLGITPGKLASYAHYRVISPINNSISIMQIRDLRRFLTLKTAGRNSIRRITTIVDAHLMTLEAQNALLKMLEEPPEDTCIFLTVAGEHSLKATVYSRAQKIVIKPPPLDDAINYFSERGHAGSTIKSSYLLSGGQAGLLHALLEHTEDNSLAKALGAAKELCRISQFDRLSHVDKLVKQKDTIPELLFAMRKILSAGLHSAIAANNQQKTRKYNNSLQAVYVAEASINKSPNSKLLLTNLFLRI
ncbi:hypothetical protein BH23PAT1_BH23PAT1_5200 [soil metagenome]